MKTTLVNIKFASVDMKTCKCYNMEYDMVKFLTVIVHGVCRGHFILLKGEYIWKTIHRFLLSSAQ